jgi:hypothetical protein
MKSEESYGACRAKDTNENCIRVLNIKNLKGSGKFLGPDINKRIILNCISKTYGITVLIQFISVRIGPVFGFYGFGSDTGLQTGRKT